MAYIYRYQIKNYVFRDEINLTNYTATIKDVIQELFKENLKDAIVESRFFEFKLYLSVPRKTLLMLGRKLHSGLRSKSDKKWPDNVGGFIRMEQKLFAMVYRSDQSELNVPESVVHIELVDSMILEQPELFLQRSRNFVNQTKNFIELASIDNVDEIIKNYYIDVFEAYINNKTLSKLFKSENAVSCFFITGFHRHYSEEYRNFGKEQNSVQKILLEKCFDVGYVEKQEAINREDSNWGVYSDVLEIGSAEEHFELVDKIENELALHIAEAKEISALECMKQKEKYIFKVHNVGQALATSIACEECSPFLYFDYGMPWGKNAHTRPSLVNMPTQKDSTIILSHLDKDHWFRIADEINAYRCHWFLPDQKIGLQLRHKLAEIIVDGGTVNLIVKDVIFTYGKLTCGGISKIRPSRKATKVHETGLALRIQCATAAENMTKCNILIAGDQEYDYIAASQLDDLDILVSSHHGGEFSWSKKDTPPIASNRKHSLVIYSYGMNNTYGHPSKCKEHNASKWCNEYHLCTSGDFSIDILL